MFKQFLKIAFRNLAKRKSFTIINILGLASAMAACLLIFFYIQYEFSFDKNWENSRNIYRINYTRYQNGDLSFKSAKALWGMARVIRDEMPEVIGTTEVFSDVVSVYTPENQIQDIKMYGTDSSFINVFDLDFIQKKKINPLTDLYSSVISESAAKRLFGNTDPLGKRYTVNQFWKFEVTGVFKDIPENTHIRFDLLLSIQTYRFYMSNWNDATNRLEIKDPEGYKKRMPVTVWDWGYNGVYSFLVLQDKTDPEQVEAKINQISKNYQKQLIESNGKAEFTLQPIGDIHLKSHLDSEMGVNSDMKYIIALAVVALIILVIAWINFINLTIARSLERAKETGVRKIVGALRGQIIKQYLIEYSIINIISVILAFGIAIFSWNVFGEILGKSSSISEINNPVLWLIMLSLFSMGLLISGFYPALVQSSFSSLALFKPKYKINAKSIDLRKVLVIAQFAASIILIIGVLVVYKQISYMRKQDLGIDIENTLVTYSPMAEIGEPTMLSKLNTYKSKLQSLPGIESVATSSSIPGCKVVLERQDIRKPDDLPNTIKSYAYVNIDHDFINSFKLTLLQGRNFTNNTGAESKNIIINQSAMRQLGLKDPELAVNTFVLVGDKHYQIIGVLKDYHQESLKKDIKPTVYFYGYDWYCGIGFYSIKIKSADVTSTVKDIRDIWENMYPLDRFEYSFLDETFNMQYKKDQQYGKIFTFFTLLAIFIAGMGLYGLATFSALNRTKEIGVRKVNGATSASIMALLSKDFTKSVGYAFIIGCPVAYYIMFNWLQNFAYRTELSWWIFILAGILAFTIAIVTISTQAWRASTRNPVETLRSE